MELPVGGPGGPGSWAAWALRLPATSCCTFIISTGRVSNYLINIIIIITINTIQHNPAEIYWLVPLSSQETILSTNLNTQIQCCCCCYWFSEVCVQPGLPEQKFLLWELMTQDKHSDNLRHYSFSQLAHLINNIDVISDKQLNPLKSYTNTNPLSPHHNSQLLRRLRHWGAQD